jgi:glucose/arabinose dehydrogenase
MKPDAGRLLLSLAGMCVAASAEFAGGAPVQLKSTPVATGLAYPVFVTHAPGDASRLFVVEQRGKIKVIDVLPGGGYSVRATPLVDLSSQLGNFYLEYGVLGLAFHPNFAQNGYFYVTYTPPNPANTGLGDWALARFKISAADPNVADPDPMTRQTVLRFPYTLGQHRGGWIGFGPDGYLYATTGDGGENDPADAAQNLSLLRGKVLRLDVDGPDDVPGNADDDGFPADAMKLYTIPPSNPFVGQAGAAPEIWAYGLRNPWRASFDRVTGDLWIGDVGQGAREEIDFQAGGSAGGAFYGWRCIEGTVPTNYAGCTAPLPPSVPPILDIPRSGAQVTSNSITGGYVYRGCAMPSLRGHYFFGDWTGKLWTAAKAPTSLTDIVTRSAEILPAGVTSLSIVSFGEDAAGELYFTHWNSTAGGVYKLEPRAPDGPDCNANGKSDACDIVTGASRDANGNGVPDECEPGCIADFNGVGGVSVQDLFDFLDAYFHNDARADVNLADGVSVQDVFDFLQAYFLGCP